MQRVDLVDFERQSMQRVDLVDFDHNYFSKSKEWLSDPEVIKLADAHDVTDEQRIVWFKSLSQRDDYYIKGVSVSGIPVGAVGIKHIDKDKATGEYWGYIGEKQYWGKGIGKEMIRKILELAYSSLKLRKIYLKVLNDNFRAISLYDKIGFKKIGTDENYILMEIELPK